MKVLVTGATGFIGARLVQKLKERGHEVLCLVREESDTGVLKFLGVKLVKSTITNNVELEKIFAKELPECVFHTAALVMSNDQEELNRINAGGTKSICEICLKHNVKRLVYLSSVAVVSANRECPIREDMPYGATHPYGISKIEAEKIVLNYRKNGLNAVILRPPIVYGEREPHGSEKFFEVIGKRRIFMPCDPYLKDRLHLIYVETLVDFMASPAVMEKEEALAGAFFIADKEVLSIRKAIDIVSKVLKVKGARMVPYPVVKMLRLIPPVNKLYVRLFKDRVYDISRAEKILGFSPALSSEEALKLTVTRWRDLKNMMEISH